MNQVAVEFLPLIQHKLENGDDDDSSSDDDQDSDDDNDDDDDDDDNEEDSDDDDDDDDDDDSDEDDDDNEAETKKQPADAAAAAAATAANQIRTVELSTVIESLKLKKWIYSLILTHVSQLFSHFHRTDSVSHLIKTHN